MLVNGDVVDVALAVGSAAAVVAAGDGAVGAVGTIGVCCCSCCCCCR